jgi:hypothetical protein
VPELRQTIDGYIDKPFFRFTNEPLWICYRHTAYVFLSMYSGIEKLSGSS